MKTSKFRSILLMFLISPFFLLNLHAQSEYDETMQAIRHLGLFEKMDSMIGKNIFDFEGRSIKGEVLNSASINGKVAVLNFWFSSCPPCIAEMPGLNEIVEHYKDVSDVKFISFTLDKETDLKTDFFPNHSFDFEIIPDCENFIMGELHHPLGFPTTYVVDKNGKIHKILIGGFPDVERATEQVKSKLIPLIDECLKGK